MKKIPLFVSILFILSGCNNQDIETLKAANQELATEKVKLEAELAAAKAELMLLKSENQQMNSEKVIDSIKANMMMVQTMLETHGVDNGGLYPTTLEELYIHATTSEMPYFKPIKNPANGKTWGITENSEGLGVIDSGVVSDKCQAGVVYISLKSDKLGYELTGCASNGEPIMALNGFGGKYVLTNG